MTIILYAKYKAKKRMERKCEHPHREPEHTHQITEKEEEMRYSR